MSRWKQKVLIAGMVAALIAWWPHVATAQQHASPNYRVTESSFGAGGTSDMSSDEYGGRATLGDTAVGHTASTAFQAYGGFTTTDEEYLEFIAVGGTKDLGELT